MSDLPENNTLEGDSNYDFTVPPTTEPTTSSATLPTPVPATTQTLKEFVAETPTKDDTPPLFRYPDPDTFEPPKGYPIRHKWSIIGLRTATNDKVRNAIVEVYWEITGEDGNGNEGKYRGSTQFNVVEENTDKLVPYDDLTEEEIIGWIKGKTNLRLLDHINSQLLLDIQMKKSVISMENSNLPWKK